MTSLLHPLHIGTLATWLSVAGFGTLAVIVPARQAPATTRQALSLIHISEPTRPY